MKNEQDEIQEETTSMEEKLEKLLEEDNLCVDCGASIERQKAQCSDCRLEL